MTKDRTVNLVGDRFDTQAGKIIADAELDEMRGSVLANLSDTIAEALREEAARAHLSGALPCIAGGWREVESAPKEHEARVLLTDGHNVCECYWHQLGEHDWSRQSGWLMMNGSRFDEPSHWQPLPLPPTPSGEEEK